jgi:hypothetical protein
MTWPDTVRSFRCSVLKIGQPSPFAINSSITFALALVSSIVTVVSTSLGPIVFIAILSVPIIYPF